MKSSKFLKLKQFLDSHAHVSPRMTTKISLDDDPLYRQTSYAPTVFSYMSMMETTINYRIYSQTISKPTPERMM